MKIKVLGTRGEIPASAPYHSKHSGVLIDNKILLDLGEKEFLKYNPEYIFITHLHPDHAFFADNEFNKNIKAKVYAPEQSGKIRVKTFGSREVKAGGYRVRAIPTIHSRKVKSQAYLIQKAGQKILYTGDMIWIKKTYHHYLNDLDLVITEGSFVRKGGMVRRHEPTGEIYGHNGVPDLARLFSQFTDNILFIHFGSWFYKSAKESRKKLKKIGRNNGVNVHVGYDGMELNTNKLK